MLKLVLKGRALLERSETPNAHQFSLKARVSYPTVERIVNRPEAVKAIDLFNLAALLTDGLGLTPEQALSLKLSDVFDIVDVQHD